MFRHDTRAGEGQRFSCPADSLSHTYVGGGSIQAKRDTARTTTQHSAHYREQNTPLCFPPSPAVDTCYAFVTLLPFRFWVDEEAPDPPRIICFSFPHKLNTHSFLRFVSRNITQCTMRKMHEWVPIFPPSQGKDNGSFHSRYPKRPPLC